MKYIKRKSSPPAALHCPRQARQALVDLEEARISQVVPQDLFRGFDWKGFIFLEFVFLFNRFLVVVYSKNLMLGFLKTYY